MYAGVGFLPSSMPWLVEEARGLLQVSASTFLALLMWLQDGGCWINLGPLLFHWADAHTYLPEEELSIELSLEEVEAAAKQLGFKIVKREMVPAAYMTNLR